MPTRITRRIVRETNDHDPSYGRTIIVELEAGGRLIYVRQKGKRRKYPLTYADLWRTAVKIAQSAAVAEAKKEREERKKQRKRK